MATIDELRKKRLEELKKIQHYYSQDNNNIAQEMQEEAMIQQQISALESAVKQRMTKEAIQRYSNIKAVDGERAVQLLIVIGRLIEMGKISKIDDDTLKEILKKTTPEKRETKIKRI